jgi:hypothetical protein
MKEGDWYKKFGERITETYYHILEIVAEETVRVERFRYHTALKKVLDQEVVTYDVKWMMEQIIQNNLYYLPREAVPFLMHV